MFNSDVQIKDENSDETYDTEDELEQENYPENILNETSADPLDTTLLKTELSHEENQTKLTTKTAQDKEVFRCEVCKEVYFENLEFLRHKYSHTYDETYTCLICHYVFKTKLGIVDHMLVFHKNLFEFGCNICQARFATKEELVEHQQKHNNIKDRPFKCGLCSLRFVTKTILNTHKLTHSIKRSIACDICHRQCASIVALSNHRRSHELVECDKCGKMFDRNNLNRHKKKVHSIGLFKCDVCLEIFDDGVSLNTHKFRHIDKPIVFECTCCYKKFDNMQKRNKHELIHNKEKIYECDLCLKRYQYFSQLQKHYRDHPDHTKKDVNKDYKPIECNICHKRYTQHMGLRNHMKTHTEQKDYECDICHKRFYTKYVLRDHLRVHTGEKPFKCKLCPKQFRTRTNLNYHNTTHSKEKQFECAVCYNKYTRKGKLLEHIRKLHSLNTDYSDKKNGIGHKQITVNARRPGVNTRNTKRKLKEVDVAKNSGFECNICHKQFQLNHSLLLHKVIHDNEIDYKCSVCYKIFEEKREFDKHKMVHCLKKNFARKTDFVERKEPKLNSYTLICNNIMTTVINPLSAKRRK